MHKRIAVLLILSSLIVIPTVSRADDQSTPYSLTKTMKIGGNGSWDYLKLNADGSLLYAPRSTMTQVISTADGKVVAEIPGTTRPHGVCLVPDVNRGFITDGQQAVVYIFDLKTNQVLGKIAAAADADGIIYDDASKHVIVVCGDSHCVIPIDPNVDPASGKADPTIDLGGSPEYLASDGQGKVFINLADQNKVAVVDTKAMKVVATWPSDPGGEPTGMSIDREKHRLFIGCRNPQKMIVMSTDDGKVLADLPIGATVDATVFDAPYAMASCGDGTLTIIHETTPGHYEVAQVLKTAPGARTMTVDPATHTVYLVTADMQPPPAAQPGAAAPARPARPRPIPGTFKVLVVSRAP